MKKSVEKSIVFCDSCGKEQNYGYRCIGCGKDYCHECRVKFGEEFHMGVHFSGHGDVYICSRCFVDPKFRYRDLLTAYLKVKALREEEKIMWKEWEKKQESAEKEAKKRFEAFNSERTGG